MYKLIINGLMVQRVSDGAMIPFHAGNRDYQDYLEWLALGNQPTPADPPPPPDTRRADALDRLQDLIDDVTTLPKLRLLCQALKRVL